MAFDNRYSPCHLLYRFCRAFDDRRKLRRRYLSYGVIFRGAGDDAFTAFDTQFLVDSFFTGTGCKHSLGWAAADTGITAPGTLIQINVKSN